MLFKGEEGLKKTDALSGGEAARLLFCKIMLQKPNVLVLDEPTNHLDLESINALNQAIQKYEGTVFLVTHDQDLIEEAGTRIWHFEGGPTDFHITDHKGPYEEYQQQLAIAANSHAGESAWPTTGCEFSGRYIRHEVTSSARAVRPPSGPLKWDTETTAVHAHRRTHQKPRQERPRPAPGHLRLRAHDRLLPHRLLRDRPRRPRRPHHLLHRRRAFLAASKALGNDLSTPMPQYGFPGLKPGDRWCVCAARWLQVQQAGAACPVVLEATHENTLKIVPFELLIQYAVIPSQLH